MLKTSILISYLINNSLLERYLNDYLLYIDFYLDPRKQKVWLDQNYRLKTIEYKSFKVLNKKLYFFVNPLTRRKREEGYRDFFLNQFKVTLNIDLYSEDIFTFTPYEDLENVLTGSTQGVGHLFYELPKFFFEKKNLGNYSLKNSSLFFTNQKEFLDLENFPDFFWPENFFLKRFLVQDFKYKLEPELLQLQDLSLEPKFNKFYKSVFYGFRKYIIPIYNKILLDYRIIFFQAMVIIYKNVNLEVPLILQLGSEFPVTYSKIRVSTKKKPINRYTPLLYEPLLIDNAYSEGGLGALAINSSFFYKKKILSIKFKHETYFYQDEFKNEELYKSYAKQQFALFNEVKYKAKKLYTLYETFGYD